MKNWLLSIAIIIVLAASFFGGWKAHSHNLKTI
jgi:DNA-binding transcriptional regulator of glucitol operon